ncbi:MAG: ATP-binding protein [Planctomycetota bacterium]
MKTSQSEPGSDPDGDAFSHLTALDAGVQPHGALLAIEPETFEVIFASADAGERLGVGQDVLGRDFQELLTPPVAQALRHILRRGLQVLPNPLTLWLAHAPEREVPCIVHRAAGLLVLEFELQPENPASELTKRSIDPHIEMVESLIESSLATASVAQLAYRFAREARRMTGFERVLVYRRHPDRHGEIIAEAAEPGDERFLGLHFREAGLSHGAERLRGEHPIRMIVDANAEPVPLRAHPRLPAGSTLDLSQSVLRSAAPHHLECLRSLGIRASMCLALRHEGELWGMMLFHDPEPRHLPFATRRACQLMGVTMAASLGWVECEIERLLGVEAERAVRSALRSLAHAAAAPADAGAGLELAMRAFAADGACLRSNGIVVTQGHAPTSDWLGPISALADSDRERHVVACDDLDVAMGVERGASGFGGFMHVFVTHTLDITFFRKAVEARRRWAREPLVPLVAAVELDAPLGSFTEYVEQVPSGCVPWGEREQDLAAGVLREGLLSELYDQLEALEDRAVDRLEAATHRALERSRAQALNQIAGLGTWEYDFTEKRLTDQHWLTALGYATDAVEPTMDGFRRLVEPADVERVSADFARFERGETPEFRTSFRVRASSGQSVLVEARGVIIERGADGRPLRMLGINYHLDEHGGLALLLQEQRADHDALIQTITHDIKTPLVTCRGFIGLALEDLEVNDLDAALDDMRKVDRAATRLENMIDDLLTVHRIGRIGFLKEPLALDEVLEEIATSFQGEFERAGAQLECFSGAPRVVADRSSVSRAVGNLIGNALKYGCPEPGARVQVGARAKEHSVAIFVRDHGPGIASEDQQRIFRLFERLSAASEGTGLGLASVAKVAEVHDGRAWVDSEPGRGACFWLELPR